MIRGFTLIETIIVVALFAFMMSALTALYLSFGTSSVVQKASADTAGRAGRALELLHKDVSGALDVRASHPFNSGTSYFSGENELVLELPAIDASGTVITNSFDYIAYYLVGTSLYRRVDIAAGSSRPGGLTLLTNAVGTLTFTYDNADFTQVTRVETALMSVRVATHATAQNELRDTSYLRNAI